MRPVVGGSILLVFLDEREPSDDVFVEHAHLTSSFFIAGPDVGPQPFIASPDFGSHRRKLTANFVAELQELRLEASHLFRQRFEVFHAMLQPIYTTGKSLLRHRRHLDCGKLLTSARSRDESRLPAVCHFEDRHIGRRRYHRRRAARNIVIP
jgi:hypothetical protein